MQHVVRDAPYWNPGAPSIVSPNLEKFDAQGNLRTVLGDAGSIDAFSRLRVASVFPEFDQSFEFGTAQLFWNSDTSGVASTFAHDANTSNVILTCGTEANAHVYRQTYRYFHYHPGRSRLMFLTGVFGTAVANVTRRMGYFDSGDGVFLEQNGVTDYAFTLRTSTSGAPSDANRVAQASWNQDKLDGTGNSGITLDFTKAQILVMDLQWLGYGRVRVGFDIGGQIVWAHYFLNANLVTLPYMKTASLPLRYEIFNTGVQGATHTFRQGCVACMTEGDQGQDQGLYFSANNGLTGIAVTTRRALISIRPAATIGPSAKVNRVMMDLLSHSCLVAGNDALIELVYNPTFTGTPTWATITTTPSGQSAFELSFHGDAAAGAFTGGVPVDAVWMGAGAGSARMSQETSDLRMKYPVTLDMNGANPLALSLVATSRTGTSTINSVLNWVEFR